MMMSEFIDRTGFEPTVKEYAKIEEAYYDFGGDKDAFCKAFVKDGGARKLCKARAAEIDRLNSLLMESEKQYKKDMADREKRIDELTAEIDRLNSLLMESEKQYKKDMADREKRIDELTAELDRELEWKPSDGAGTNMEQKRYEELAKYGKAMTDEEAKVFIADECGFDPEKIRILHEVNTYEVNKHRRLRKSGTFDRAPVYEATDWNYVRFDCAYSMYELVNGELCFYCC